jgi:hypothetical protein
VPEFAVKAIFGAMDKFSTILGNMGVKMGKFGTMASGAFEKAEHSASIFKSVFGGVLAERAFEKLAEGAKELVKSVPEFADRAEAIGLTASKLGIGADALQRLTYAAKIAQIPAETLQSSIEKLNNNIAQFRVGTGAMKTTLVSLNPHLAAQMLYVRDTRQAFLLMADTLSKTKNAQDRAAIAQAVFGKAGQEMLPMLTGGRKELEKLINQASIYSTVLDDKTIRASTDFSDNMTRLKGTVQSVKDQVLGFVVKALSPYLEKVLAWVAANKALIATKIETFITRFANALHDAKPVILFLWNAAGWLIRNWPLLLLAYVGWTAAQIALNFALDANPIGAIVIAIEAMVAAVIIVIHYWKQITGALEAAWNWFDKLYNKSLLLRNAIFFLASPVWLVVEAIRTLVDLLSGKGLKSFENFIPPWLKGATDRFGLTQRGGGAIGGQSPNAGRPNVNVNVPVNVNNSRAPGVSSTVAVAPAFTGYQGVQYAGAR